MLKDMKKIKITILAILFLIALFSWCNSYFLFGRNLKWCILDLSPIWFEKIEIIIYDWNLVYFAIGMPEVRLALAEEQTLLFDVGNEPVGVITSASLSQGYHYYSLNKNKFIKDKYAAISHWVTLPTMSRSTYFVMDREVYATLKNI